MTKHTAANPDVDVFAKVMARLLVTGMVLFLASNLLILWRDDAAFLFLSQIVVVPVWAVIGSRSVAARCITAFMFAPITLVYLVQMIAAPKHEHVIQGEVLVVMSSMVLLPATLRVLGYVCTANRDQLDRNQPHFQFSIREILGLTTLVAVSIFIVQMSGGFLPVGGLSLLLFLPGIAAWAVFSLSPLYAAAVILCFLLISTAWNRFQIDLPAVMMYLIGVTSPLVAFRSAGFRLTKVSTPSRPLSAEASSLPQQAPP